MVSSDIWTFFRNFCGLLVDGFGGGAEYFSNIYPASKIRIQRALFDTGNGTWKRHSLDAVFSKTMVEGDVGWKT